ncbi:MAG: DUF1552 domain-containing protein [Phycisphaerales bacterium]|nr:DUF1552 domain-containing protein [Phycisphaerales bacterium]
MNNNPSTRSVRSAQPPRNVALPAFSRRAALRGVGVTIALPWLEAMSGGAGRMAAARSLGALGGSAPASPVRVAFVFAPNGVNHEHWAIKAATGAAAEGVAAGGSDFALSPTLAPLAPVRSHVSILTGLTLNKARANGDGPGDHARSSASFLTGMQARKTAGNDIRIGVSVDQVAARAIGGETRLPSLELGCEAGRPAGSCDSGYSCAYSTNISWADEDTPVPRLVDPSLAFERLFGNPENDARRTEEMRRRASILDLVMEDSRRMERRLGAGDRRKLDEFQTSIREIERRIQRARAEIDHPPARPDRPAPAGIPRSFAEHIDLMYDMMLLGFRMDVTRVGSLAMGTEGTNRTIPEIGVKEGHHHLSHHQGNAEMIEKIRRIDRFYVERFAAFVSRLAQTPEGGGSLLDNCLVVYGCGIGDGNQHNHDDLPVLLAGRGGNEGPAIRPGRVLRSPHETPLCNLYVSMLQRVGSPGASFGDSTGPLDALAT